MHQEHVVVLIYHTGSNANVVVVVVSFASLQCNTMMNGTDLEQRTDTKT